MIAFLGHQGDEVIATAGAGRNTMASEFLCDVLTLAERLPQQSYGIILCGNRYRFAVALAALMRRGQAALLPSSANEEVLKDLAFEYGPATLLVDDSQERALDSLFVDAGTGRVNYSPQKLAFPEDAMAAVAFTSGSTGKPLPNRKNWGTLAAGGRIEAERFGLSRDPVVAVVGTVPPQHMYGLESTVIMPLQSGLIMHSDRPFFPDDVRATLEGIDADRVLVTTPVHMRALIASEITLPALHLAICATAPLSEQMACQFEDTYRVQVHEVYGFTEAGMVATRRTVEGPTWHLLSELRMRPANGTVYVSGGHVPAEVPFTDLIEPSDPEHFVLLGRSADLVNVAGKRTSIAFLDHQLGAIPGVNDAAFYMPDDVTEGVTRLTAFAVAPHMTREEVLRALAQRIDPVFLPRPLVLVDELPRNATGKLPRSVLRSLARRCAGLSANSPIVVERSIDPDHPALPGHFPTDPIVPGVVLLDLVVDVAATEMGLDAEAAGMSVRSAKFLRPVRPGDVLKVKLKGSAESFRFECSVAGEIAASGLVASGEEAVT